MTVRPIDASRFGKILEQWRKDCLEDNDTQGADIIADVILELDDMPILTTPSEWVSMETPPTTQGWYHIAVLDLKTGKYTVEQDLYSIELAKAHGFEPGFCKANRWKERERIDYWCRFPAPPNRRPPKEEMKDASN